MREYDDVRKLIEEESQNSYEREALNDVVSLLEGNLSASPRETYRDELRKQLLAEAQRGLGGEHGKSSASPPNIVSMARRHRSWIKTPALGAAAAVLVVALGSAMVLSQLGARTGGGKPLELVKASEAGQAADGMVQSFGASGGSLADNQATAWQVDAGVSALGTTGAGEGTRGLARSAAQDGGLAGLVKVPGGTAEFRLEAPLPVAPSQANGLRLRQLTLAPDDIKVAADLLGVQGEVQSGFDHLWVGAPLSDQPVVEPDLPPYKQPGRWIIGSPDWGRGWSFAFRDDLSQPSAASAASPADAERAARSFLQRAGLDSDAVSLAARPDGPDGSYWLDWRLTAGGREVRGVEGGLRVSAEGRVVYASWPAFRIDVTQDRQVRTPDEALQYVRSTPFDWFRSDPKLTVTQVALVYRLPPSAVSEAEVELDLAYEFTVRDADGSQSALYVPAWR